MEPAVYSNVWYATRNERGGDLVVKYFFRKNKSFMSVYVFSGSWQFIGLKNNLWRLESYSNHYFKTCPRWYCNWYSTRKIVKLEWYQAWRAGPDEWRLLCKIHDGDEQDCHVICIGWLYNVTHSLIRLQRWVRRMQLVARARQALLMALHPRLGAMCLLASLGPDLLFQDIMGLVARI